jgi:hypothetical protein
MKIDFTKLINESGEKFSKAALAREMVAEGLFKTEKSAINMIQYHQAGHAKSCGWELLKYLSRRFKCPGSGIIQWDD